MAIKDLAFHSVPYVTVGDLAVYWEVSRRQVYKHVETGALQALKLGPRCYRIRTQDALQFERSVSAVQEPAAPPRPQPVTTASGAAAPPRKVRDASPTRGSDKTPVGRGRSGSVARVSDWKPTLLVFIALMLSCVVSFAGQVPARDYVLGPKDVVTIGVWGQSTLSGKYNVEADGTFTFPLIGRVQAAGKSLRALQEDLTRKLADGFIRDPDVSVTVDEYRSQRIFVMGEVQKPGSYALSGDMTLIEALAMAGATTVEAAGDIILVHPRSPGKANGPTLPTGADGDNVVRVDLVAVQSGALDDSLRLGDGDTIFVPRGETAYVYGYVRTPGAVTVRKDATVLQALSMAGGVTERGAANRITIERLVNGEKKEFRAALLDSVKGGDTIIVPQRRF